MWILWLMVAAAVVLTAADAGAQPAPAARASDSRRAWTAHAGYEVFSLRDISRHMRPPDASPISWNGEGPALTGRYEISGRRSAHAIDASWVQAGSFTYQAPTQALAAPSADSASRLEARYEYRRYFWRDLGLDGLDLGLGVQGIGARTALDRHITASLSSITRIAGGGGTGVILARLRRWDLVHLDASWANGAIISRRDAEHGGVPDATATYSGGSLLSETAVRADWKMTSAARLSVTWRRCFEEYASDHFSYASVWQSLNVGVVYAR